MQRAITDDLEALLAALPERIAAPLGDERARQDLLEIVLDLGRLPEARFSAGERVLSDEPVMAVDLELVAARIGEFGDDNRAGIERTLHRISAIRNRKGRIVGLTCRIGRAVYGTIDIIRDIVESGKSILLLGRPGVGKTTMLREVARVLADDLDKRVIVVDTSNEIAGDGDIPHPAIGRARRMQVSTPAGQHSVMIEAVENHMPEVIIIDEIGTELEAAAARTIAERGVQLIGTAHGNTLDNLMINPTLSDLIGGIQSVTLGDEEARRRGTQKSVLERKAPPTFDVVVEILDWHRLALHRNVAETVDSILRGYPTPAQVRSRDESGEVRVEEPRSEPRADERKLSAAEVPEVARSQTLSRGLRVYPFGVSRNRLELAIREMQLPVTVTHVPEEADTVITLKNYYRKKHDVLRAAESAGVPIHVLKNNTVLQIENFLASIFQLEVDPTAVALHEAEVAVGRVLSTSGSVELSPQNSYLRRLQHQMAERHNLGSVSKGREPHRRVVFQRRRQDEQW